MDRRNVLKAAALGLSLPAAGPLLVACGGDEPAQNAGGGGGTGPVKFEGWDYEPTLVQQNIDRYTKLNADAKVSYTPVPSAQYVQKLVAEFTANNGPDALYVYDDSLAGWVEAGYLQPIDGLPGVDDVYNNIYPSNASTMTYKGKRYGLPYYTDAQGLVYNAEILSKAGFTTPPKTLDEWEQQSTKIKSSGLLQYPIGFYAQRQDTWWAWFWALVYGSGGALFDDKLDPVMNSSDSTTRDVLTWLQHASQSTKVIDPASLQTTSAAQDPAMMESRWAYCIGARYSLSVYNDPAKSKAAGKLKMGMVPSLDGVKLGTVSHTRMYCLAKNTKVRDSAFKLLMYLGGYDNEHKPYTAKFWFLQRGLGFTYKELANDAEVTAALAKFIDPAVYAKLADVAKARNAILAPWYREYEAEQQKVVQGVLSNQTTPADAAAALEKAAKTVKAKYS
jgi:multiple sugar transport system substrate-binding protein